MNRILRSFMSIIITASIASTASAAIVSAEKMTEDAFTAFWQRIVNRLAKAPLIPSS